METRSRRAVIRGCALLLAVVTAPLGRAGEPITGVVRDRSGSPIADATVHAWPTRTYQLSAPTRGESGPPDEGVEQVAARVATERAKARAERRTANTRADGAYELGGLDGAAYELRAWADGYEVLPSRGAAKEVAPGSTVDFVAFRVVDVPVRVLMPDGRLVREAGLELYRVAGEERRWSRELWTAERAFVRLPAGTYELRAFLDEAVRHQRSSPVELVSESVALELGEDRAPSELVLRLAGESGVFGLVSIEPGDPLEHATVYLMEQLEGQEPDLVRLAESEWNDWIHRATGFGYRFEDVAPGEYGVGVAREWDGDEIVDFDVVRVEDGVVRLDLSMKRH